MRRALDLGGFRAWQLVSDCLCCCRVFLTVLVRGRWQGAFRSLSCGPLCFAQVGLAVHPMRCALYLVAFLAALQAGGSLQYACPLVVLSACLQYE